MSLPLFLVFGAVIGALVGAFQARRLSGAIYGGGIGLVAGLFVWAVLAVI